MNTELNFKGGIFVSSKDCLGYQKVLDDFNNSKIIKIVTFNISKNNNDDKLFNLLLELEDSVDVQIITNTPSKLEWYATSKTGEYLRRTASTTIDTYLKKLNPTDFDASITPFFNFNNHSKIIGTENIVYIGSANFSNESAKNYETGIIIEDKDFIKKLYESFFDNLKSKSIPYFTDEFNQLRLFILSILTRLINHYNYLVDTMFIFDDHRDEYIFIHDETSFSQDDLFELIHDLYELKELESLIDNLYCDKNELETIVNSLFNIYDNINVDSFLDLIYINSVFYDYVLFSLESSFDDCFEKYSYEAYDEYLDHYVNIAMDEAKDILYDICNDVEVNIENIRINLKRIIESLNEMNIILSNNANKAISSGIDNTK